MSGQSSLTDFSSSTTDSGPDATDAQSSTNSSTSSISSPRSQPSIPTPLANFYSLVTDHFSTFYSPDILSLEDTIPLSPQTKVGESTDFVEDSLLLPSSVGPWTLDYHTEDMVTYRAEGYGTADDSLPWIIHRIECTLSKSGEAAVSHSHISAHENPEMVKNADTSDDGFLSPRGWSPKQNPGDNGLYSGTVQQFSSPDVALAYLVSTLHVTPGPLYQQANSFSAHPTWSLASSTLTQAHWVAPAPPRVPADEIKLVATRNGVSLKYSSPLGAPARREYHPVYTLSTVPSPCYEIDERKTHTESLAPSLQIVAEALQHPPSHLLRHSASPIVSEVG